VFASPPARSILTRSLNSLRVGKVCNTDNREIAEAIYEVDLTPLQGPEVPPEQADQAASTCTFGLRASSARDRH
jgi:hypothetical protein